jgi:3-phenylpropionate/trans-cinnamate dioxygenase ferredoxin subunit
MGDIIECPKHNGRFNYKTGEAKRAPVCIDLRTYPVKVEAGTVFIKLHA